MQDDSTQRTTRALVPAAITAVVLLGFTGMCTGYPCVTTGLSSGLWLEQCPATDLRASADLEVANLVRGDWGHVYLSLQAHWMTSMEADGWEEQAAITQRPVVLDLVDESGEVVPGVELREPSWANDRLAVEVRLPEVPDGHYTFRARAETGFEEVEVSAPVALFTPALVHVIGDRPLYKPGQEVLLRAAVLARTDQVPVEGRPGTWIVRSPDGTEMLKEKARTDAWGVVDTTFPLATDAEEGRWTATYRTGHDERTFSFDVRPFKLPRFTVQLEPSQSWYAVGQALEVTGTAKYTSGAPVADADVEVSLRVTDGRWPMPLAWEEPVTVKTDRSGKFLFERGDVPADLVDRASIQVMAAVTDEAGERRGGATSWTLSSDDLRVDTVTAFDGGLVEAFNNRAYLRIARPDGAPLANTDIVVRNAYQPTEPVMKARTDADGVAAIQLDPGAPVTLVTPPPPARIRPFAPAEPSLASGSVLPGSTSLSLQERRALDRLHPGIATCGELAVGAQNVQVAVQVASSGRVVLSKAGKGVVEQCVERVMRSAVFSPGEERMLSLTWQVPDALLPSLQATTTSVIGSDSVATRALEEAALRARRCFRRGQGTDGSDAFHVLWSHEKGDKRLTTTLKTEATSGLPAGVQSCVRSALTTPSLDASWPAAGVTSFRLHVPQPPGSRRPQALTTTGFQLEVLAMADDVEDGRTKVTFPVGSLPALRMRATPSLATPGDELTVELLRGPAYGNRDLPEKLVLREGTREVAKAEVKDRKATFQIPDDVDGFLHIEAEGARAVVFVQPDDALTVALSTDAEVYRPGENARLTVKTLAGQDPVEASVMLAGVDSALGELAPLASPDDWGDVIVRASGGKAFDRYGPRALQLGQVRGENAAKAAVLLVQNLPMDSAGDQGVYQSASTSVPAEEALITAFYVGLERLVRKVRAWEAEAPEGEEMKPPRMAKMWDEVLEEAKASGQPIVDGFGRPLGLTLLPPDLLAQTAPRQVVADSRRLPEDVQNWPAWVVENL